MSDSGAATAAVVAKIVSPRGSAARTAKRGGMRGRRGIARGGCEPVPREDVGLLAAGAGLQRRFPVVQELESLLRIEHADDLGSDGNRFDVRSELPRERRRGEFRVDVGADGGQF